MSERDHVYLVYIRDAIVDIYGFLDGDIQAIYTSSKTQAAVLYRLQTIAETTQRLSKALKDTQPQIDWLGISGFRNRLVHEYMSVNLAVVASIIERDLPMLHQAINDLLAQQ